MILVSDLLQDMRAAIDADDTTYYREDRDYYPAINKSVRAVVALISRVLSTNRLSDDAVREISKFMIKDVASGSILIPPTDSKNIWTITLVAPSPTLTPEGVLLDYTDTAERMSTERWGKASGNPFEASNTIVSGDLTSFGYISYATEAGLIIKVRPNTDVTKCAIGYLEKVKTVNLPSDVIALPESVYQMVLEKALWFISYKQGDNTTLAQMSASEESTLITFLT